MEDLRAEDSGYRSAGRRLRRVPTPGSAGLGRVTDAAVSRRLVRGACAPENAGGSGSGPLQRRPQVAGQGPGPPEGGGPGRQREGTVEAREQGSERVREGDLPVPLGDRDESKVPRGL